MIKSVCFYPRTYLEKESIASFGSLSRTAVISILDPLVSLHTNSASKPTGLTKVRIVVLRFHDTEPLKTDTYVEEGKYIRDGGEIFVFTEAMAKNLYETVCDWSVCGNIDRIIIHCTAGKCRSAAIARWAKEFLGMPEYYNPVGPKINWDDTCANQHVYQMLLDASDMKGSAFGEIER